MVPLLVERVAAALADTRWEIIFVDDDSPDGTTTAARRIARIDPRVRCLRRIGRRGSGGSLQRGILSSSAPVVAIMDADLQHDESLLLRMLSSIDQGPNWWSARAFPTEERRVAVCRAFDLAAVGWQATSRDACSECSSATR
jgi:glycosyltransferase involved in cell wall biosynthesis